MKQLPPTRKLLRSQFQNMTANEINALQYNRLHSSAEISNSFEKKNPGLQNRIAVSDTR